MRQTTVAGSSVAATATEGSDGGTPVPHGPFRWRWLRPVGGLAVLVAVVWWFVADAFLAGARTVSAGPVVAALGIAVVTTLASAWRWRVVACGLGLRLRWPAAVAACYRSQFLNVVLPGGVVGDVHRGVKHGRDSADLARGLRAVAWERSAGQVVQLVLVLLVFAVVPSPVRATVAALAAVAVVAGLLAAALGRAGVLRLHGGRPVRSRALRTRRRSSGPRERCGPWAHSSSASTRPTASASTTSGCRVRRPRRSSARSRPSPSPSAVTIPASSPAGST